MRHDSYIDYFLEMRQVLEESDSKMPTEKKMDVNFRIMLEDKLKETAKQVWQQAENLERESYILSDDELEKIWEDCTMEYTSDLLKNMSELGFIKMSVGDDGEILYSISDEGKEFIENNKI